MVREGVAWGIERLVALGKGDGRVTCGRDEAADGADRIDDEGVDRGDRVADRSELMMDGEDRVELVAPRLGAVIRLGELLDRLKSEPLDRLKSEPLDRLGVLRALGDEAKLREGLDLAADRAEDLRSRDWASAESAAAISNTVTHR
jgi:hypothetical protein